MFEGPPLTDCDRFRTPLSEARDALGAASPDKQGWPTSWDHSDDCKPHLCRHWRLIFFRFKCSKTYSETKIAVFFHHFVPLTLNPSLRVRWGEAGLEAWHPRNAAGKWGPGQDAHPGGPLEWSDDGIAPYGADIIDFWLEHVTMMWANSPRVLTNTSARL